MKKYKGIEFNSKLEMQWARYFDELGWDWEYRRFRTSNWIPDFKIKFKTHIVLAEIRELNSCETIIKSQYEIVKSARDIIKQNKDKIDQVMIFGKQPEFGTECNRITLGLKYSKEDDKLYPSRITYDQKFKDAWDKATKATNRTAPTKKPKFTPGKRRPAANAKSVNTSELPEPAK
jgi:hypothetical protein